MKKGFSIDEAKTSDDYERLMVERAHGFAISRFHGAGVHETYGPFDTIDEAIDRAQSALRGDDKNLLHPNVYARPFGVSVLCYVSGVEHQTCILNIWRDNLERLSYSDYRRARLEVLKRAGSHR